MGEVTDLRKKVCARCKHKLSWDAFHAKEKHPDGTKRTVQSYCKPCQLQRQRELYGHSPRNPKDPDSDRRAKAAYYQRNRERILEAKRARYRQQKRNPKWLARKRENDRLSAWSYRRKKGVQEREFKKQRTYATHRESARINAEPFAKWLEELSHKCSGTQELAFRTGLLERTIRRVLTREFKAVSLDLIDRALLTEGHTLLVDLYPELYEFEEDDRAA